MHAHKPPANPGLVSTSCLAVTALAAILAYDKFYWRLAVFGEGPPEFSHGRLFRSAVIACSVAIMCWSAVHNRRCSESSSASAAGSARWSQKERWGVVGVLFTSIFFLGVFLTVPSLFARMSLEDGPVEWASAIVSFAASGIFAASFLQCRNVKVHLPRSACPTFVLFATLLFLIGMEETSWFQRVFGIATPDAFRGNEQHELTLHNFATDPIENAYYFGAFAFLVVLPFARSSGFIPIRSGYLELFMPRPISSVVGAVGCAYNFDMWNILFIQVTFFGAVAILLAYSVYHTDGVERIIILCTAAIITLTQLMFLTHGENFSWLWQVTEYKEFFIPIAFLFYAMDVYRRTQHTPGETSSPVCPAKAGSLLGG